MLSRGHDGEEEAAEADDNNNKEGQREGLMMRRRRTTTRTWMWTFVWFLSREKRKVYWYYCHSYGFHRTIRYSLHPTWTTGTDSDRNIIITNVRYTVFRVPGDLYQHDIIIQNKQQYHPIVYMVGIIM